MTFLVVGKTRWWRRTHNWAALKGTKVMVRSLAAYVNVRNEFPIA